MMNFKNWKLIMIIVILLAFLFFLLPSASEETGKDDKKISRNDIVITLADQDLKESIIIGDITKPLINPKSVSIDKLLKHNEYYHLALEADDDELLAASMIYLDKANEQIITLIKDYAQKNNIQLLFKEEAFFPALKKSPDWRKKTNKELKQLFDITDDIISYGQKKKEELEKKKKNADKSKEEKSGLFHYIFQD